MTYMSSKPLQGKSTILKWGGVALAKLENVTFNFKNAPSNDYFTFDSSGWADSVTGGLPSATLSFSALVVRQGAIDSSGTYQALLNHLISTPDASAKVIHIDSDASIVNRFWGRLEDLSWNSNGPYDNQTYSGSIKILTAPTTDVSLCGW